MKKNNTDYQWPEVWNNILDAIIRIGTPAEVRKAAASAKPEWRIKGNEMHVVLPDVVSDYIERNMDAFKPILEPFLQSHHCSKLIYR